jgi:hypothetical protein
MNGGGGGGDMSSSTWWLGHRGEKPGRGRVEAREVIGTGRPFILVERWRRGERQWPATGLLKSPVLGVETTLRRAVDGVPISCLGEEAAGRRLITIAWKAGAAWRRAWR